MSESIKIAILGGSNKSAVGRAHVAAIRLTGMYQLVAGFMSRNDSVNVESGHEYGIAAVHIYSSLDALISFCKMNQVAILVCTPTDQHLEQVNRILDAGVKVICEKALGNELEPLIKMQSRSNSDLKNLAVIYNYTSYPAIRKIRELIANGAVGKVLQINASMPQESFLKTNSNGDPIQPQSWRLKDAEIPTLSLDLGVHLHILVKLIINKRPVRVLGKESSNGNFSNIVDNVRCIAEYEDDIEVNFWYSKIAIGHRNGLKIEVFGKEGSIIWEQFHPEEILYSTRDGSIVKIDRGSPNNPVQNSYAYSFFKPGHPEGFIEALANYYTDLGTIMFGFKQEKEISSQERIAFGLEASLEGIRFLKAIKDSSRERTWKTVEYS